MEQAGLPYLIGGLLVFGIGLYGVLAYPNLVRKILALNILGTGVFMVFIATGYRGPDQVADPVPHALVITGIVVSVCAAGLALALATRIHAVTGMALITPEEGEEPT